MILEYHRPDNLDAALNLLARRTPLTIPLGGGSVINRGMDEEVAVVDIQNLSLNSIQEEKNQILIGAGATIHSIMDWEKIPESITEAAKTEMSYNQRQIATIAGTLFSTSGRSPLATIFLAMDAIILWQPGNLSIHLDQWMSTRKREAGLIVQISIPLEIQSTYLQVARTPRDWPLVCAAAVAWPDGRRRLVIGGTGAAPCVVGDGGLDFDFVSAARRIMQNAGDEWASAEYRTELAGILAERCIQEVAA